MENEKEVDILIALIKKSNSDHAFSLYVHAHLDALTTVLEKHFPNVHADYHRELYQALKSSKIEEILNRRKKLS